MATFTPDPHALRKEAEAQSERDWAYWSDKCLALAVDLYKARTDLAPADARAHVVEAAKAFEAYLRAEPMK